MVFAGYAQQIGAQHVLSPRRSALVASVGMRDSLPQGRGEQEIFDELRRRIRDLGPGWRIAEQPWTPSFLPLLLSKMNVYKDGPEVLLRRAKELRGSKAVRRYAELRRDLAGDVLESNRARDDLTKAADRIARDLHTDREGLKGVREYTVDVLPSVVGPALGAAAGLALGGPPGAIAGAAIGPAVEQALIRVNTQIWGWTVDRLPFRSARKLLSQSVQAELKLRETLGPCLRNVWERRA